MTALTITIAGTTFFQDAQATTAAAGGATPDGVLVTSNAFETVLPWFPVAGLHLLAPVVKREVVAHREKLRTGEVVEATTKTS